MIVLKRDLHKCPGPGSGEVKQTVLLQHLKASFGSVSL